MLLGTGAYNTPQLQSRYADHRAYMQISDTARKVWKKVPDQRGIMKSFSTIQQSATETFLSFVDRLAKAIEMQVDNSEAASALLRQLVYEHANQDCQAILKPYYQKPDITIADMLRYCQNVSTETHKASLMAAAIVNNTKEEKKHFNCGQKSHFKVECRSKPQQRGKSKTSGNHFLQRARPRHKGQN